MSIRVGLRRVSLPLRRTVTPPILYSQLYLDPSVVVKVLSKDLSEPPSLTLDPGETWTGGLAADKQYVYAVCGWDATPTRIVRVQRSDFTRVDALELAAGELQPWGVCIVDGYLYVILSQSPTQIVRVRLSPFERVDSLTLNPGENAGGKPAASGGYLYTCGSGSPGKVVKTRLSPFSRDDAITFNSGEDSPGYLHIVGNELYAGCNTVPGTVVKATLTPFARDSGLTLNAGESDASGGLASKGLYLYVGTHYFPSYIVKVLRSTLTRVNSLQISTALEGGVYDLAIGEVTPGVFNLYVLIQDYPGRIREVNLSSFTKTGEMQFASGEDGPEFMIGVT